MRYAVIGDIHGNLEALQAVVDTFETEKIDEGICVGDIVGYGANPVECIDLVQKHCVTAVAGNHDYAVIGLTDIDLFNPFAKQAVMWTSEQLKEMDIEFLATLRLLERKHNFTVVHSSLEDPKGWGYILNTFDAAVSFELQTDILCFVGHTHVPVVYQKVGNFVTGHRFISKIDSKSKYIINVGSVGQSRDGDPRASYIVYDTKLKILRLKRVEYDICLAQQKILSAGLPEILADRLSIGR